MTELFTIKNGNAFPSIHALLIEPFKTLWETDTSDHHGEAIKILTYIELYCNPRSSNPYFTYKEEERAKRIKKMLWHDENYDHPDFRQIILCTRAYQEFLNSASPTYNSYLAGMTANQALEDFLNNPNILTERNFKTGNPLYKPSEISKAIRELADNNKVLIELRNKVNKEMEEESSARKQRKVGAYEE